ncbi:MAG: DUF5602 domain-containing protein [Desulfobacterales bacterium]
MVKYKIVNRGSLILATATMLMAFTLGCSESKNPAPTEMTFDGPSRNLGDGRAYAFEKTDISGKPVAIGLRMSETALAGLQSEPPHDGTGWETIIPLPKEAATTGYDHIGIDWNPKGHIPNGIYDKPHFDFHFYMISQAKKDTITAKGKDLERAHKAPAPEYMPEGYILPKGTEVARMGAHAIDPSSPEFNKQPFTKTFIYGFYDGQMVFFEPMMTKAFLETKPNTTSRIKLPKTYAKNGYYPTAYSVRYDAAQREFEISLDNLIYR